MSIAAKTDPKPSDTPTVFDIAETREAFNRSLETIANNTFKLFDIAAKVKKHAPEMAEAFLRDCRVSDEQVPLFLKFQEVLGKHIGVLLENQVTLDVVMAMLRADEPLRVRMLRAISSGAMVTADTVDTVAKNRSIGITYTADDISYDRRIAFDQATQRIAAGHETELTAKAATLLHLVSRYRNERQEEIKAVAEEALFKFELLFGAHFPTIDRWFTVAVTDPTQSYLAQAHHVLGELAAGFLDDLEFHTRNRSWYAVDALAFLAGRIPVHANFESKRDPKEVQKLNAVAICAGSGGIVLGLEAARFSMVGLNESDSELSRVIKKNRPDLIQKMNLADIRDEDVLAEIAASVSGAPVDLIAGALPTSPFTLNGKGGDDRRQLLTPAFNLVKLVRPRAFFFEVNKHFDSSKHLSFRQNLIRELDDLGYMVRFEKLNAQDHGVPQIREHHYLVGILKKYSSRFVSPSARKPVKLSLREAIGDIVLSQVSPYLLARMNGENVGDDVRTDAAKRHDAWATSWLSDFGDEVAPDIREVGTTRKDRSGWHDVAISYNLEKLECQDTRTSTSRVALTIPVLKRLLGVPDDWQLTGANSEDQLRQLQQLTPPRLALALARSVHAALTGEEINWSHRDANQITTTQTVGRFSKIKTDPGRRAAEWSYEIKEQLKERGLSWQLGHRVQIDPVPSEEANAFWDLSPADS